MPANLFPPEVFAREIEAAVHNAFSSEFSLASPAPSVTVEVHDKTWLEQQNMGGVLGVAQGSRQPPFFVEINYVVSACASRAVSSSLDALKSPNSKHIVRRI